MSAADGSGGSDGLRTSGAAAPVVAPGALIRSTSYRALLVIAAVLGVLVSIACWGYLELIHFVQQWVYQDLPSGLGFATAPWWWPVPVLAVAGVVIAFAVARLPSRGGHDPSEGLKTGPPTSPVELPGVLLAALASIGLGLVLGPEAPLILEVLAEPPAGAVSRPPRSPSAPRPWLALRPDEAHIRDPRPGVGRAPWRGEAPASQNHPLG